MTRRRGPNLNDHDFLTHKEAAKLARCHENTLHSWNPPCRVRRGRKWLYPAEAFRAWLEHKDQVPPCDIDTVKPSRQNRRATYRELAKSWQG